MIFQQLKVGAGGFLTGLDFASTGACVVRTDTFGAYYRASSSATWSLLNTTSAMPAADYGPDANGDLIGADMEGALGVYEIVFAPSNASRLYMVTNGRVFRSDDAGVSWIRTGFTRDTSCSATEGGINTNPKLYGPKMAVDPQNADIVYLGTGDNGLWVTVNAGTSWAKVTAIANPTSHGGVLVVFDPNSGVSGGKKQGIYASSYGTGVYSSTDGGTNWTLTTSTPTTHIHMRCSTAGLLFLAPNDGSVNLKIYSGTWSSVSLGTAGGRIIHSVAIDPADATRIIGVSASGDISVSTNSGGSFAGFTTHARSATAPHPVWHQNTNEDFMGTGDQQFDPSRSNVLCFAEGIGYWEVSPGNGTSLITWATKSAGIEQLVAQCVISPPGGDPIIGCWDRAVFRITDPNTYPSNHGVDYLTNLENGWSIDYASATPTTIVVAAELKSGKSSDGGTIWTLFGTLPPNYDGSTLSTGCIAASTTTNFVLIPSNNSPRVYYTTDAGANWIAATITGPPTSGETGWGVNSRVDRQIVCADRVNANTFYAYNNGAVADATFAGIYKSTDSGANWTKVKNGRFTSYSADFFAAHLRSVPGQAGHLFYTAGDIGGSVSGSLFRSTDAGANWSTVSNVLEAHDIGFGAAAPGQTYPSIYIAGWVNGTAATDYGIWRSIDNCASWSKLADFPYGNWDFVKCISGDANTYGKLYVGFSGSGFSYGTEGINQASRLRIRLRP